MQRHINTARYRVNYIFAKIAIYYSRYPHYTFLYLSYIISNKNLYFCIFI